MSRDLARELNEKLCQMARLMRDLNHGRHHGPEHGPRGYAQARTLRAIADQEGITQRALMDQMYVRPSSMSEMLSKLEGGGLIERRPDPEDRRQVNLYLRDAGREQLAQMGEEDDIPNIFAVLSEEEQAQYLAMTDRIIEELSRLCEARGIPHRGFGHGLGGRHDDRREGPRPPFDERRGRRHGGGGPGYRGPGFPGERRPPHEAEGPLHPAGERRPPELPGDAPVAPRRCNGCEKACKLTMPECGHGYRMAQEFGIRPR